MQEIRKAQALARRMDSPRAEDALIELGELQELAVREREKRAAIAALDSLLDDQLDHKAYGLVLAKKRDMEAEARAMSPQLSRVEEIKEELTDMALDAAIRKELTSAGATRHVGLMARYLREEKKIEGRIDDSGKVQLDTGRLRLFIDGMKTDPGFQPLFGGPGSRAMQESEGNPWRPESFNLSRQGEIYRQDSQLAARLQREAQEGRKSSQGPTLTELGRMYRENPAKARELAAERGLKLAENGA